MTLPPGKQRLPEGAASELEKRVQSWEELLPSFAEQAIITAGDGHTRLLLSRKKRPWPSVVLNSNEKKAENHQ